MSGGHDRGSEPGADAAASGAATGSEALIQAAREARDTAYAPYSRYQVGCALRAGGVVYRGANIENASYGLCICAERVACALAAMHGARVIDEIAVVTSSHPPAAPCGMCLQTLAEFCADPAQLRVILVSTGGERRDYTLAGLIPYAFVRGQLTP